MAGVLRRELLCACVFIVLDIFSCAPITVTDDFNETSPSVIETGEKNNISSAAISTTLSPVETKLNDALGQIQISNHQIDSIQEKLSAMSDSVLRHWAIFRRVYTEIGAMLNLGTPGPRKTETVTSVTDTRSSDPGSKDWTLHTPSEDETEDKTEGNSTETVSQEEFNKPQSDQGFNRNHARDSGMGIPGGAGQIGEMSRQSGNSNTRRLGEWHMLPEDPGELPHRMFEPLTVEEFEVNSVENNSTEVLSNGNVVVNVGLTESGENDDNVTSMEGADISHELYYYDVYNTGYNGGPSLGGSHGNVGWNGQNYGTGPGWNGGPGGIGNNGETGNNRGNIPQAGSGYGGNEGVGNYGQGRINGGNIMHTGPGFGGNGRQIGGSTGHNGEGYGSWGHSGGNTGYGGNMGNVGFRNGGVGHSGSSMANSGTTGGNFGNTGGNAGYSGGNAGNRGGREGNNGGIAGSNGGNLGNTGGSEINSGGKAGHNGGNAGNRGGKAGNRGGNAGNTGGNAEHNGGSAGNRGGNTQNTSNGQLGRNSGNPGLGGNPSIGSGHGGTAGTGVGGHPHNLGVNEGHAGGTGEQNGASGGIYNNNGQGIYNPEGMFNPGQGGRGQGGRGQGYYGPRGYYGNSEYNQWENENEYEAEFEPEHEEERVFPGGYPNPQLFNMGRRPMANAGYLGPRNPNFAGNGYGYAWGPGGVGWMGWMNPYGRGGQFPGMNSGVPGTGWNSGRGLSGQGFGPGYPEGQRTGPGGRGTGIGGRGTGIGGGPLNNGENTSNNTGMNGEATNETLTAQENGGNETVDGLLGQANETIVDWFEESNVTDQDGLNGRNETIDDMFGTANETAEDILAERNETIEEFLQNRNETIDEMIRELNETLEERLEEINETLQFEELFPYNGTIFKEPEINIENGNETYETEFENVGNDLIGNNKTDFEPYGGNVVTGESQFERYVDGTGLPANSSTSHMSSPIIQYEDEYRKPNTSSPVNSADPATNSNRSQPIDTANDSLLQPSNKGDNPTIQGEAGIDTGSVPARNAVGDPLLSRKGDNPALQGGAGSDTVSVPDTKTQMTGSYYSIPTDRAGLQERKDSIYKSHKEKDNLRQRKSVSRNHHTAQADRKDKADNLLLWTPQYADVSPKDLETFRRVENHYDELDLDVPEVDATSKNTDLETDGDVPNQEHNYEVDEKPRYKRHLNFPGHALNGRQFPFHKDQLSHVPSSKTQNPGGQHDKRYVQHAPVKSDSVSARPELARLEVSDSYDSMTSSESRGFDSFDSSQGMTSALSKESLQFISSDSHHLSNEQDLDRKGSRSSQSFMDSFDLDNSFDHDLSDESGWWYRNGHYKLKEIDDQMKSIRTKLRRMMKKYVITNKLSGIKTSIASKINLYPKINEVLKAVVQSVNPNKHSKAKSHEWKLP